MEKTLVLSIIVLIMINITDSITSSIVGPSLVFYVTEMGGTKEEYGMISSSSFLSGMLMMSFYGHWVDQNGNKYKAPYTASFILGILGSLIYFFAIVMPKGRWAVYTILMGRLVTGMGASGRTLAYSYVATAIPHDQQRTTLTVMSMTRSFGMLLGPLMNLLVSEVDTSVAVFDWLVVPIDRNNSVGLIVAFGEIILLIAMFLFLTDPPPREKSASRVSSSSNTTEEQSKAGFREIWEAIACFDLFLPMATMFVFMFNFQLYGVAIPPVGFHALGWDPVQISNVLAVQAIFLFVGMCVSMYLSLKKAPDIYMIGFGNLCFIVSGTFTYLFWTDDAIAWQFVLPVFTVAFAYPFLGPANRSKFTKAVHGRPELGNAHGVMQSLFNQGFMLAGFISPNFVASYVLRRPEDVGLDGSSDHELTPWAWYIPITSTLIIIGLLYEEFFLEKNELGFLAEKEEIPASETSTLLEAKGTESKYKSIATRRRSSVVECTQAFSREFEVNRRASVEINGIPNPFETSDEIQLRDRLWKDKQEWEHLQKIDAALDETEGNSMNG